jgi:tRNA(fMet)-specific endonuclease VapC
MNGKFLIDTNAVIALLGNNRSLATTLSSATWIGISIITELEFLSFSNLLQADKVLFEQFKSRIEVISLDTNATTLIQTICQVRQTHRLKLPDSIIAATALTNQATLLTNDAMFSRINGLNVQTF